MDLLDMDFVQPNTPPKQTLPTAPPRAADEIDLLFGNPPSAVQATHQEDDEFVEGVVVNC